MTTATGAFFSRLFDYAGLFPPAALSMEQAVADYAAYRRRPDAWVLNRFVVPVRRLQEFAGAAAPQAGPEPWPLAALAGPDVAADAAAALDFNARNAAGPARIEVLETAVRSAAEIEAARRAVPAGVELAVELPFEADLAALTRAAKRTGATAKMRTGGVRPADIPAPDAVLRFLEACAGERLAFKATAGLHHPVRALRPLTYEPGCARATMFGYLNVFVAAIVLWHGHGAAVARAILAEEDAAAFRLGDDALGWRELRLPAVAVAAARRLFATAIGSCSFTEPVEEIRELGARLA